MIGRLYDITRLYRLSYTVFIHIQISQIQNYTDQIQPFSKQIEYFTNQI